MAALQKIYWMQVMESPKIKCPSSSIPFAPFFYTLNFTVFQQTGQEFQLRIAILLANTYTVLLPEFL
jgi:hypothetical protein